LAVLIGLSACSMTWALDADAALARTITFAGVFVLLHLFALLDTPFLRTAWTALFASAALSVLAGLTLPAESAFADEGRFTSGGLNPNDYAGLLLVILFAAGSLARGGRVGRAALALLLLAGVLWSGSRTAFVALAAAPVLLIAFSPSQRRGAALRKGAAAYVAALLAVGAVYALDSSQAQALHARAATITDYRNESTWAGRLDIWRGGLELVAARPLLGSGAGNFPIAATAVSGIPQRSTDGAPGQVAHNVLLGMTAELGLAGLLVFSFLLARALMRARALARVEPMGSALLLGLLAYSLMAMSLSWEYAKVAYMLMGSVLALGGATIAARAAPAERSTRLSMGGRLSPTRTPP
ncbi:MAG TPA: O-antigen ligase family protein, partial [Verrucomicrobiae bacterium]|nr:O-antigen ligase family protein [Verrucomicrobiae bacterium]